MANDTSRMARRMRRQDRVAKLVLGFFVALVVAILVAIVARILYMGAAKLFDWSFLTGKSSFMRAGSGIGAQLFNSFYLLALTLLISVPVSLGAAIFLAEYAPKNRVTEVCRIAIEALSSLPSIIVGLFGFLLLVIKLGWGFSIMSGAVALTMFNIPILVRVMQQALLDVPRQERDAALALGLTKWETITRILIPSALPAIVTGVVLSAGRVFGEAAALIYTAGQSAPKLDFANFNLADPSCPWNVWRPAETLAVHIWKVNAEGVLPDLEAVSNGTAAVLLVCILISMLAARLIGRFLERKICAS
jgi:phosphate transport system permease protein